MASAKTTVFLKGKVYWAKVLGEPGPNFNRDGKEWTFEFEPDADGVKTVKALGLGDRLKNKHEGRAPYLTLKRPELQRDGTPNEKLRVYDTDNKAWDPAKLIGNGSTGDVKLDVRDYGVGKKKGVYPVALRIHELVAYVSNEFGGMDGVDKPAIDDGFKADLDDDVAF